MNFCEQIKSYKAKLNVSQRELCELLYGVPHRTLQSWLMGEKTPPDYVCTLVVRRLESILKEREK
ncbi:hypothetical protein CWE15_10235 [Aliidiomarina taiwanensis]|uniref:Transcriptional regulator n=1 Tax=Aliidiomarina taiwanensis TaxID=946228 RepID=A0A432WYM6_9GAMM|nr:hypothetical protein CWE15_10235 [Aliidiomarina taiwanensis]